MELQDAELAKVRQYVGTSPTDSELYALAETVDTWQDVALHILRVRLADATGGDATTSFALSGVLSVGIAKGDAAVLAAKIRELEDQLAALSGAVGGGVTVSHIRRPDRRR